MNDEFQNRNNEQSASLTANNAVMKIDGQYFKKKEN